MALLSTAVSAGAAVTSVPVPQGQVTRGIPGFVLSSQAGGMIHWRVTDPDGDIVRDEITDSAQVTVPDLPVARQGVHTLLASDDGGEPAAIGTFVVDTLPPGPPTVLSGPAAITGALTPFAFTWSLPSGAASSQWQVREAATVIAEGGAAAPVAAAAVQPLLSAGDHLLTFRVRALDAVGNPSAFSPDFPFGVDQTPPGQPVGLSGPSGTSRDRTPSFSWRGAELGGTFEWDVTDAGGRSILGPGPARTTTAPAVTTPTLALAPGLVHRLTFRVRQVDVHGNRGPDRAIPVTITTASAPPVTRFARFMTPVAGHTVGTLRPLLRWRKLTAGATIYNVQIYAGNRKVLGSFSTRTAFRVPRGRLARGTQYVWHVWAYVGARKQYVARPMSSYFVTRR